MPSRLRIPGATGETGEHLLQRAARNFRVRSMRRNGSSSSPTKARSQGTAPGVTSPEENVVSVLVLARRKMLCCLSSSSLKVGLLFPCSLPGSSVVRQGWSVIEMPHCALVHACAVNVSFFSFLLRDSLRELNTTLKSLSYTYD